MGCAITSFTAGRWRSLLAAVCVVVADVSPSDLYTEYLIAMLDVYALVHRKAHTDASVQLLRERVLVMRDKAEIVVLPLSPSNLKFKKWHFTLCHAAQFIVMFGASPCYSAQLLEALHKCELLLQLLLLVN